MINYITPILKAQSSTEIQLKFKENYGDLYKNYSYLSNLTISLVNASFYDYIISTTDDPDVFNIILNFSTSLTVNPILTLYLNPPDIVLFNNSNTNKLTSYKLQASLFNYYYLDEATKSALAATTSTTTSLNSAASNAFSANNIMMGSSFGIKSLVSIDIIRFLRYFTVDYPPSVIAIYETSMPNSFIFPVVNLDEEDADGKIPDIFLKYDLYSYAFNNNGNILIETFVYFLLGALILLIIRITHRIKNRYFRVFLIILRLIFVWNYCLSSFLSQIMPFSLAAFLGLRYPTKATHIGYFNYIFAILCVIFIFAGFIIFFFLIRKLKPNLQEKFLQEQNTKLNSPNVNDQADLLKNDIKNTAIFQEPEEALSKTSNKIKNDIPKQISGGVSINYSINEGDSPTERAVLKQTKMNTYKKSDLEKSIKLIELNSPTSMLNDNTGISIKNNENEISFDMPLQKESSFSKKENIKVKDIYLNKDVIAEKILEEVFSSKETSPLAIRNTPNTWYRRIKTQINTLITKINRPESKFDWRSDDLEDFEQTMELLNRNFSPLHKDFKHSRTIQSYYFLFDMGRQVLLSFLVSFLHDHPFQGLILVNIVNLLFFAFLLCINPFKDKIDVVQNILNEICLLLSSFSALVLACMEKFNLVNMDFKLLLGWFMVGTNTLLILVFLLRMLFNFILIFYAVAKTVLKAISRKIRKRSQIIAEKIDDQDATKNKEDQSALQQIIELQNFFK